jgi:hypothetical protein
MIRLNINRYEDRNAMIVALANHGYKTWVEECKQFCYPTEYFVCFGEEQILKGGEE